MKKDTIISGPKASGKNWISKAIEITHKNLIRTSEKEVLHKIDNGFPSNITDQYSLMVINEATKEGILIIEDFFNGLAGFDISTESAKAIKYINIVYLTKDNISSSDPLFTHLHVINCRNAHI